MTGDCRLVLVCLSEGIYRDNQRSEANRWVRLLASHENRHTLPLFTSLLNTVTGYQPASSLPYNHLLWTDSKEGLVEVALQVDTLTECSAVFKVAQNTFDKMWCKLPEASNFWMIRRP